MQVVRHYYGSGRLWVGEKPEFWSKTTEPCVQVCRARHSELVLAQRVKQLLLHVLPCCVFSSTTIPNLLVSYY